MRNTILALSLAFATTAVQAQTNENQIFKEKYLQQVEKNAVTEAKAQLLLITSKHKLEAETYKTLYQLYYNRRLDTEKALMNAPITKNSAKDLAKVLSRYDSISNVYLQALKTKSMVGDKVLDAKDLSKFASAVRNRSKLKLNKTQVDSLVYQSKLMAELKKESPLLDLKAYERKHLPTILTDEQYTDLLIHLNRKRASEWTSGSIKSLQERGINQDLDSTRVRSELFNYNLAKLVKKDRFGDEAPKASQSLQKMTTEQPEALKRLQSDQARNVAKKPAEAKTNFAW